MKLYEIQRVGIERMLTELQTSAIDKDLEQTAQGLGASTAARTGDASGMPDWNQMAGVGDPMGGDPLAGGAGDLPQAAQQPGLEPDPSMMAGDGLDGAEELETKKIDTVILSKVQGMPYVDQYDHGNSKVSPEAIMHMEMDELNQLRNAVLNTIKVMTMQDKYGLYDDPSMKGYQDLRDFVDKVLDMKKRAEKPVKKRRQGKTAKWDQKPESKNSKSKQYRKPPTPKGA